MDEDQRKKRYLEVLAFVFVFLGIFIPKRVAVYMGIISPDVTYALNTVTVLVLIYYAVFRIVKRIDKEEKE